MRNQNIIVGVSGSIAAYKAAELVRLLKQAGAEVQVVMTEGATAFITAMTLQALSGRPVRHSLLDEAAEAAMSHIELAKWADLVLIAPASAACIARLATGQADDLLSTLCLATTAPIFVAPAMNQQMWQAPAVQDNVTRLQQYGMRLLGPAQGEQACGDFGPGRLLEPEQIVAALSEGAALAAQPESAIQQDWAGLTVMITAGPTRENIDPVRYLSNYSSGKMGYALATAAQQRGARVILVSGPVRLAVPNGVQCYAVESALEMHECVLEHAATVDVMIGAAAVADFRPQSCEAHKIKKGDANTMTLKLVKNPDIIATVAKQIHRPFTVGFAAETEQQEAYATKKLVEKELDMIALNDVSRSDIGFNSDDNCLRVLWHGGQTELAKASKSVVAQQLLTMIREHYEQYNH